MSGTRTGNFARSWLKRLTGLWSREPLDRAALIEMLRRCEPRNLLDPDALIMIEGAIHVSDMQARDIMIPRVQMVVVRFDASLAEIVRTIVESGHSRFPVVGDDTNNVLGVVLVLLGILMSVPGIPGQGVLTILLGLMLVDLPGKRRLESKILGQPKVLARINRLRHKFSKPPLILD